MKQQHGSSPRHLCQTDSLWMSVTFPSAMPRTLSEQAGRAPLHEKNKACPSSHLICGMSADKITISMRFFPR